MQCDICRRNIPIFPAGFWGRVHTSDGVVIVSVHFCSDCMGMKNERLIEEWVAGISQIYANAWDDKENSW